MGILRQVLCSWICCCISMTTGLVLAWPSSTVLLFSSNETALHRPMTETEISLLGSLFAMGALISTPISGYLLDIIGRKQCALICSSLILSCWVIIAACSQVEMILAALFIAGIGGAGSLVVPNFVSEICQENIRGTMTSGSVLFYTIGVFVSYVLGVTLPYRMMVYACLTLSLVGFIMLTFVRETPTFLMKRGLEEEAAESFAFYRSAKADSKEVMAEMVKLRRAFDIQSDGNIKYVDVTITCSEGEKLNPVIKPAALEIKPLADIKTAWIFFRKSRSTRQATIVTLTLVTAATFQGLIVLQVFAGPIFLEAVPNMSSIIALVIFSLVTIVSGFITAYLSDVIGRRNLMIYFSAATGLCCIILGSQLHVHWAPHWVTALFIYLFTATYSFGAGTVPFILVAEVFLPEVKSFMSMLVMEWSHFCYFVILFIYNPLVTAIGLGPTFYFFAAVCALTAIFSAVYLPETKGLTVAEIQGLFTRRHAF